MEERAAGTYLGVRDNLQSFYFLPLHVSQKQAARLGGRRLHLLSHLDDACVEHFLTKLQARTSVPKLRIIALWRSCMRLRKVKSSDG